jgi:ABC-2 type transport system permease protein
VTERTTEREAPQGATERATQARRRISPWVQLGAVFRKEVLQTVRDRRIMVLLTVAPLIQTIMFGFAVDFEVDQVPTVVVDFDASRESRAHARSLLADGTLQLTDSVHSVEDAETQLDTGEAAAAVVLPKALERDLLAGRAAEVQVVLDGTDPNRATVASGAVARYFGEVGRDLARAKLEAAGAHIPEIELKPRVLYNPSLRTPPYIIPGVMGMLLLIVTTIVTAMGMARERETGTLEQVLVTPIRPLYLLIGKMAPFLVIGFVDVGLVLTGGAYLFNVPLRGNLGLVLLASLLYLMSTLGVGLFISTISKTQQQSFLGGFLFALPAILLSGVMTPIRAMPMWLQTVTLLNPIRYFVEVMRAVLLKAATFEDLQLQLGALALFGLVIISTSAARFQKTLQ